MGMPMVWQARLTGCVWLKADWASHSSDPGMMPPPRAAGGARLSRCGQHFGEREMLFLVSRQAIALPRGGAVAGDAPLAAGALERLEGGAQPPPELGPGHLAELRLGVVQVVEVDARDAKVAPAALDLVVEEARGQRVAAGDDLVGAQDARLDERLLEIGARR